MPKTYTFGALGLPYPKIEPLPFPEPSRIVQQMQEQLERTRERIIRDFMVPEHVLRGDAHPIIEGEFVEIKPLAIKGPK